MNSIKTEILYGLGFCYGAAIYSIYGVPTPLYNYILFDLFWMQKSYLYVQQQQQVY